MSDDCFRREYIKQSKYIKQSGYIKHRYTHHVATYTQKYTYRHAHTRTRKVKRLPTRIHTNKHKFIYSHIHTHKLTLTHMHIHTFTHINFLHVHTNIETHTHTHIDILTHSNTHICSPMHIITFVKIFSLKQALPYISQIILNILHDLHSSASQNLMTDLCPIRRSLFDLLLF